MGRPGTVRNGGAGANAGTNSSRLVVVYSGGWWQKGGGWELGAGSREAGELGLELGSFTGGGTWAWGGFGLGAGNGNWSFGPVGTIPTMGRFRRSLVPTSPPALLYVRVRARACMCVCVCNWSQSRYRSIPDTDSPWRLTTLTIIARRRRNATATGKEQPSPWSRLMRRWRVLSSVSQGLVRCPCSFVTASWVSGRQRGQASRLMTATREGGKGEVRGRRGGIGTGTNKICDGVHGVHIPDQTGHGQDTANRTGSRQGTSMGRPRPLGSDAAGGQPQGPSRSTRDLLASHQAGSLSGFQCASLRSQLAGD